MDIFSAMLLGLAQGLTEFIPVSSSGHLTLLSQIFNVGGEGFHFFIEMINIGTLLAMLVFFRKRIWKIITDVFTEKNYKLALNIVITSVPAGILGLCLSGLIEENPFFSSLFTVTAAMGIVGIIMMLIDKLPHLSKVKSENELSPIRALVIGLCQALALIPGVSRSGATITTGRIMGMNSKDAAEYSFLASIPIMLGVCAKTFVSADSRAYLAENIGVVILGNTVAFLVGLLAISALLKYLSKEKSLQSFGKYRLVLSLIVTGVALILL